MMFNKIQQNNSIPESLLTKIYDCTGSASGGNKGFFIAYVNENGEPSIISKTQNACVDMALVKILELFVDKDMGGGVEQ